MTPVNISFSKTRVFNALDAEAIRFTLMISEFTYAAGDIHIGIMSDFHFDRTLENRKSKLKFIAQYIRDNKEIEGYTQKELDETLLILKVLGTIKHKNARQIHAQKTAEKVIDLNFEIIMDGYKDAFERSGLSTLKKFANNQLQIIAVSGDNPEPAENDKNRENTLSGVLLDKLDSETPDDIYLVTGDFTQHLNNSNAEVSNFGDNIKSPSQVLCARDAIITPRLLFLTENEIELIREEILKVNEVFRKNMDSWSRDLLKTPFTIDNFKHISNHYLSHIKPELKVLQKELDKNERLNVIHARTKGEQSFRVSIYVTAIGYYWDYLIEIGALTQPTIDVMKQNKEYEELRKKSCIIIEGAVYGPNEMAKTEEANAETLTKRKILE